MQVPECTGLCCSSFTLGEPELSDPFIRDMLIDLGDGHYSCKHWDTETRLCRIYEQRPQMCRDYPEPGSKVCGWCA